MSSEIKNAFAHPIERAIAMNPTRPVDRIALRGHIKEVEIGAYQEERGKTQRLCFDVVVEVSPPRRGAFDDVDQILSYDKITDAISAALAEERLNLLESLAERIACLVLAEAKAQRIFIRIEKLDRGPGSLGVETVRAKGDFPELQENQTTLAQSPKIIFVHDNVMTHPNLVQQLGHLARADHWVLICVDMPQDTPAIVAKPMVQKRIDLLAIEQNAWRLAAQDTLYVVVATKTELEWSFTHNKVAIWAPSKMVLDAIEAPKASARDALGLALWLARSLGVQEITSLSAADAEDKAATVIAEKSIIVMPKQ